MTTRYLAKSGVATITLDCPDRRNALSGAMINSLAEDLDRALADPGVRVIVLTNTGTTFCAGADLKGSDDEPPRHRFADVLERMVEAGKPVVGRIAGHCVGGGNGLAAACDISIAADDIRFAFTEVRLGVAPAIISVVCLPKLRRADALELFLTGNRISAERAAAIGLINRAVPRSALDEAVNDTLDSLLAGGPNALAAAKDLVFRIPQLDPEQAFDYTTVLSAELFASEESRVGRDAFRNKCQPGWIPSEND